MAGQRTERVLAGLCRFVYRRASMIIAQSRGMGARIAERVDDPEKVRTIYNWAEEELIVPRGMLDLDL